MDKQRFTSGMLVKLNRKSEVHKNKGFTYGKYYSCFLIKRNMDLPTKNCGIYIRNDLEKDSIRLQDLDGNLTGHGTFFEPVDNKDLLRNERLNRGEENEIEEDTF